MKKYLLALTIVLVSVVMGVSISSCSVNSDSSKEKASEQKLLIIFDTDMGNDIDDALALDMLYKYQDQSRIKLLGIATNKKSPYCVEYIDIMNTWYGYPEIPIGVVENGTDASSDDRFIRMVCEMEENGRPVFERSVKNYEQCLKTVALYRKLLAEQKDNSVDIISVGFSTNLAQLLDSEADEYSPLTGKELVSKKVKLLSAMMGNIKNEDFSEFNVHCDILAAQKVVREWPTRIIISPHDVGEAILYPGSSIENDFKWKEFNPMVEGYKAYQKMPYDRQTWDLTSVLYVVERDKGFFGESSTGTIEIDDKGITRFTPDQNGKHKYLTVTEQQAQIIRDYFVNLITQKPMKYQ